MQAADQHTFAQLGTKRGQVRTLFGDTLAQFRHVNLALGSHHLLGLVNGSVVHTNAGFTGHLQLCALIDQSLKRIAPQFLLRWQFLSLLGDLRADTLHLRTHFAVGDGLGVHHGDDEVRLTGTLHLRRCAANATDTSKGQSPQAKIHVLFSRSY